MALVITRFDDEAFWIGDTIRVSIRHKPGGKTGFTVAIDAPRDVPIYREEICPVGHPGHKPDGGDRGASGPARTGS